jgi:acyl transferase domain-containing protein
MQLAAVPDVSVLRGEGDVTLPADPDREDLLRAVAELYVLGCNVHWERVAPDGELIDAPSYQWAREHLWLQPLAVAA